MACGPVWCTDVYGFDYETIGGEADGEAERSRELAPSKTP